MQYILHPVRVLEHIHIYHRTWCILQKFTEYQCDIIYYCRHYPLLVVWYHEQVACRLARLITSFGRHGARRRSAAHHGHCHLRQQSGSQWIDLTRMGVRFGATVHCTCVKYCQILYIEMLEEFTISVINVSSSQNFQVCFKADGQDEYQVQHWLWIPSSTEVDLDPTFTDSKAGLGAFVAESRLTGPRDGEIALDKTWPDSRVDTHDFPAEGGTCGDVPWSSSMAGQGSKSICCFIHAERAIQSVRSVRMITAPSLFQDFQDFIFQPHSRRICFWNSQEWTSLYINQCMLVV